MKKQNRGQSTTIIVAAIGLLGLMAGSSCSTGPTGDSLVQQAPTYQSITAADAKALIDSHAGDPSFVILDVRTSTEFASGHIANAVNMSVMSSSPAFSDALGGLSKSDTYFVYCSGQHRSPAAIALMKEQSFTSLYELIGGLDQWKAAGLPVAQ